MKLLREYEMGKGEKERKIELYNGDLTKLPGDMFIDLLVVSAFPNSYVPVPGTLIGALHDEGLSVQDLSVDMEEDMRQDLGCWFSKELPVETQERLHVKRILCFEPATQSNSASEVVGNIFRCINNFIFNETLNHVALPIVASGNQKFPVSEMFEALLDASLFWMKKGLPLQSIKLVHKEEQMSEMLEGIFDDMTGIRHPAIVFSGPLSVGLDEAGTLENDNEDSFTTGAIDEPGEAGAYEEEDESRPSSTYIPRSVPPPMPAPAPAAAPQAPSNSVSATSPGYDLFVSYSHKQKEATDSFVQELRTLQPALRIFYDDGSIAKGAQWLKEISNAIDASRKVVIFISPEYTQSKICWDEFQCAKVREYNSDVELLITIYLKSHDKLPTIFQLNNWIDCREADLQKIKAACNDVMKVLAVNA